MAEIANRVNAMIFIVWLSKLTRASPKPPAAENHIQPLSTCNPIRGRMAPINNAASINNPPIDKEMLFSFLNIGLIIRSA